MRRAISLFVAVTLAGGCALEEPVEVRQQASVVAGQAGFSVNALNFNALNFNALNFNALNFNALNFNALNFNALNFNALNFNALNFNALNFNALNFNGYVTSEGDLVGAIEREPRMAELLTYYVQCALAADEMVVIAPDDMAKAIASGEKVIGDGTFPMWIQGRLGLTPEWLAGRCDEACQQANTACLEAHGNAFGVKALISLGHPTRLDRTECEADLARRFEAVYYGQLFSDDVRANAALGADVDLAIGTPPVDSDPIAGAPIGVAARACFSPLDCAIKRVGWAQLPASAACGRPDLNACTSADATACTDAGFCGTAPSRQRWFDEILWVFRPNRSVDIKWHDEGAKHYDFQVGAPIAEAATPCLTKLRADPAMAHCFSEKYYPTACDDPATFGNADKRFYDKSCVRWTKEHCGTEEHPSLLEEGPPLAFGLSDCIDHVGGARPSCVTPERNGGWWDDKCVDIAAAECVPGAYDNGDECSNLCVAGKTRCAGSGVEICGDWDGDGCTEWSPAEACGEGMTCSGGTCEASCESECAPDTQQCSSTGGGLETCADSDGDGCYEWNPGPLCLSNQICNPETNTCESIPCIGLLCGGDDPPRTHW